MPPQHQVSCSSQTPPLSVKGDWEVKVKLEQFPSPPGWTPNLEITRGDFYSLQISGPPADQIGLGIEIIPPFSNLNVMGKGPVTPSENPPLPVEVLEANLSATKIEVPP